MALFMQPCTIKYSACKFFIATHANESLFTGSRPARSLFIHQPRLYMLECMFIVILSFRHCLLTPQQIIALDFYVIPHISTIYNGKSGIPSSIRSMSDGVRALTALKISASMSWSLYAPVVLLCGVVAVALMEDPACTFLGLPFWAAAVPVLAVVVPALAAAVSPLVVLDCSGYTHC